MLSNGVNLVRVAFLIGFAQASMAQSSGSPVVLYSSAKAGPNQGWEGSSTRGAAISIWGRNFGSSRGCSFVTVAGVALTGRTDYAEWGATTNPTTAKGLERITFWLNPAMSVGNTAGISVTVNGVPGNTLPFTIDNTGVIRFIDGTNGNDSWDGLYKDHSLGGSHGPWKIAFMYYARAGTRPGTFFYMRGGTYRAIFDPGSGHPGSAYIGYFEQGGTNCTVFYPQINGTDVLRYTVTSYPGEMATFSGVSVGNKSSYWTFANFRWTSVSDAYGMGDEWSMCGNCQLRSTGLDLIGMAFDGPVHHVVHSFGDNFRLLANYINVIPVGGGGGTDAATSYPLYLSSGNNLLVKDNEIHGGAMYAIHHYDESRCAGGNDINRYMNNSTFDSNLLDLTRNATNPVDIRAGILTGTNIGGNAYNNTVIKNNVIYSRDNLASEAGVKLFSESTTTLNGVYIYNNTLHNVPWGLDVWFNTRNRWLNVVLSNNIFSAIRLGEVHVDGGSAVAIQAVFQYNLATQSIRVPGNTILRGNIVGQPAFAAPTDFHLQAVSPAIDAGVSIAGLDQDYDGVGRPQGRSYDIGALEYAFSLGLTAPWDGRVRRIGRNPCWY